MSEELLLLIKQTCTRVASLRERREWSSATQVGGGKGTRNVCHRRLPGLRFGKV